MRFTELPAAAFGTVEAAVAHLEGYGLLAHPTSGVYGIGGRLDPDLDREVARLKGRPEGAGLIRLVSSVEAVEREFPDARWSAAARRLADEFWPGPLTLVLEDGSQHGLAVRAELHPFTRALLAACGRSLGSSSLNAAGGPPAGAAGAAREVLAGLPPSGWDVLFVDAGRLPGPPPSTLVRCTGPGREFEVLRPGPIPLGRLAAAVADLPAVAGGGDG